MACGGPVPIPVRTMVADQVTCISCTSGICTPFGGYYTVHIGSTQHTTGYMYANTGPIRDGIKPGWQGPLQKRHFGSNLNYGYLRVVPSVP